MIGSMYGSCCSYGWGTFGNCGCEGISFLSSLKLQSHCISSKSDKVLLYYPCVAIGKVNKKGINLFL